VIRIHPAETKLSGRESREQMIEALAKRIPMFPANVTVIPPEENTSTYELMQEADIGLVYSSTTGLEMAMLGKPVVVAARTHYRGKGFTIDVSRLEDMPTSSSFELRILN
jgi:lipid A disaccharide synthetase